MTAIGIIVGAAIAVGGWMVNGVLARRSVRRDLRVQYLTTAYRHLDAASNRPLSAEHGAAIESAVSDIQLFGSERQVRLADSFARSFADDGGADTAPLLEDLRSDLRRELLLGEVSPRAVWLRIGSNGQWASESARVRSRLPPPSTPVDREATGGHRGEPDTLARTEPLEAVLAAYQRVERALVEHAPQLGELSPVHPGALGERASEQGLISPGTADAIDGLTIMRKLAIQAGRRLNDREAEEFVDLARAAAYAIRHERPRPSGRPAS